MDVSTDTLALAGLIIALFAWLRQDIKAMRQEIKNQADEIKALAERVSRMEGLLEGLWRPRPWPEQPPDSGPEASPRTGTDG